ncbi:hypothetical protein THRCLA_10797 [Thraustotheca clavata]|uniref:Uncharacterized protein n=1 Tax=Thraustotheca clavata TaxID=74557 RepID=A0A1V9YGP2_9STRA|nr:hypothetical protein THRCLA_10797 [Thraustotheca clavata]
MSQSWWDVLDAALKDVILAFAGPLTQYLSAHQAPKSIEGERAVWNEAYSSDWPGDLASLPNIFGQRHANVHKMIHSKSMYARYQLLYGPVLRKYPFLNEYEQFDPNNRSSIDVSVPFVLIDEIVMHNCWLEELKTYLNKPIALAHAAAIGGHANLLGYLQTFVDLAQLSYAPNFIAIMDYVAGEGFLDVLEMLHDAGNTYCTVSAMDNAAVNGHLEVVKWLHENRTEGCTSDAFDGALLFGHEDVLKYLQEHSTIGLSHAVVENAIATGNLHAIEVLHTLGTITFSTNAMDLAASHGHFDIVQYLHIRRSEGCTKNAMDLAARHGHINIVKFLHEHRTEGCTVAAMNAAAFNNHLEILSYLHYHRREGCTTLAMDRAAHRGHLKIVKFLHQYRKEGCTTRAIDWAASRGHLDVAQFLMTYRKEGFTYRAILWAATKNHREVLRYLCDSDVTKDHVKHAVAECKVAQRQDKANMIQRISGVEGDDQDILLYNVLLQLPDEENYTDFDVDQMDDDAFEFNEDLTHTLIPTRWP